MKKIWLSLFIGWSAISTVAAQDAAAGKDLFTQNCSSCHAVGKQVVGPDLMNVDQQRSEKWIINFVHSSQTVIKSGDTAAVNLYNEFGKTLMPDHPQLKDGDIKNIIAYIKDASAKMKDQPKGNGNLPATAPIYKNVSSNDWIHKIIFLDVNGDFHPMGKSNYFFWGALATIIILLVTALLMATKMEEIKRNKEKENI